MNRSYSKIRHIQESNILLEQRRLGLVKEQGIGLANIEDDSVAGIVNSLDRTFKNCSDLNGKSTDELHPKVKRERFNTKKGGVQKTIKNMGELGKIKRDEKGNPIPKSIEVVYNEDPYSYVELFNGKFCTKKDTSDNWIEVTDSKQIESIKKELEKED